MAFQFKWTIRLSIVAVILAFIGIALMGAGHGFYTPAMIMFPVSTFNTIWEERLSMPLLIGGLFEYPLCGFILDNSQTAKQCTFKYIGTIAFHFILAFIVLALKNPEWR